MIALTGHTKTVSRIVEYVTGNPARIDGDTIIVDASEEEEVAILEDIQDAGLVVTKR